MASEDPTVQDDSKKSARARWPALESNPETFTAFLKKLIAPGSTGVAVHDVFGFEPDLLAMIPQPVYAMIFLYPSKSLREKNPPVSPESADANSKFYLLRQTKALGNACGTIACIHALANLRGSIPWPDDSLIGQLISQTAALDVSARGEYMETY